jgi:hypothetical protein
MSGREWDLTPRHKETTLEETAERSRSRPPVAIVLRV